MAEKKSVRAKSTPRKRMTKKPEEPKPASEIQRPVEPVKPREINWDVLGFSSAAVTLLGVAIFFWIGWIYDVTWYGFYGISMNKIQLPIYEIIAQSIPSLLIILAIILSIYCVAIFIRLQTSLRTNMTLHDLFSIQELLESTTPYVFLTFVVLTVVFLLFLGTKTSDYLPDVIPLALLVFLFSSILGFRGLIDVIKLLPPRVRAIYVIGGLPDNYRINDAFFRNSLIILVILFSSALLSGYLGLENAKIGKMVYGSGSWDIHPVLLVTSHSIQLPRTITQTCDSSGCISGPFGDLGENSDSYIFIKWDKVDLQNFSYHPGLYIIPKSENTYLIPYATPEVTNTSVPSQP